MVKKLAIIMMLLAGTFGAGAQKMMGHRGSLWGVENTRTAFINGALAGFDGVECDIKMTADDRFVITHDDILKRISPDSVDIRKHDLYYLQNIPLKQIRGRRYYEGNLCSLDEYLDICKEYHVIPLIEIKWSSKLFSSNAHPERFNYDGIPALLKLIEFKGMTEQAIVMTSMRGVLAEIRRLCPEINLQLLVMDKWEQSVDFCFEHGINIDVRRDVVEPEKLIRTFHEKGLEVNVWCVDTEELYDKFSKMRFDYITTNSFIPEYKN